MVVGALTIDGDVDLGVCRELIDAAGPLSVTFHRAFDMARDPHRALEAVAELGATRLLTSGQERTALDGTPLIRQLVARAGDRLRIMAGGGVTARNARRIVDETGVEELHFTAGNLVGSPMRHRNPLAHMGGALRPPEYARTVTDEGAVRAVIAALT